MTALCLYGGSAYGDELSYRLKIDKPNEIKLLETYPRLVIGVDAVGGNDDNYKISIVSPNKPNDFVLSYGAKKTQNVSLKDYVENTDLGPTFISESILTKEEEKEGFVVLPLDLLVSLGSRGESGYFTRLLYGDTKNNTGVDVNVKASFHGLPPSEVKNSILSETNTRDAGFVIDHRNENSRPTALILYKDIKFVDTDGTKKDSKRGGISGNRRFGNLFGLGDAIASGSFNLVKTGKDENYNINGTAMYSVDHEKYSLFVVPSIDLIKSDKNIDQTVGIKFVYNENSDKDIREVDKQNYEKFFIGGIEAKFILPDTLRAVVAEEGLYSLNHANNITGTSRYSIDYKNSNSGPVSTNEVGIDIFLNKVGFNIGHKSVDVGNTTTKKTSIGTNFFTSKDNAIGVNVEYSKVEDRHKPEVMIIIRKKFE